MRSETRLVIARCQLEVTGIYRGWKLFRVNRQAETQTRRLETRIRRALNGENNFSMVFQPIFSLAGPMVGAEALARFRGPPKRGPDRWFAEADKVGLRREL